MLTVRREIGSNVVWIRCSRIIIVVATIASIWCIVVIAVVTGHTIICNGDVCTLESPILTVVKR